MELLHEILELMDEVSFLPIITYHNETIRVVTGDTKYTSLGVLLPQAFVSYS